MAFNKMSFNEMMFDTRAFNKITFNEMMLEKMT